MKRMSDIGAALFLIGIVGGIILLLLSVGATIGGCGSEKAPLPIQISFYIVIAALVIGGILLSIAERALRKLRK